MVNVQDENSGVVFRQLADRRAGAQTNFCDGKNLVEGEIPVRQDEKSFSLFMKSCALNKSKRCTEPVRFEIPVQFTKFNKKML